MAVPSGAECRVLGRCEPAPGTDTGPCVPQGSVVNLATLGTRALTGKETASVGLSQSGDSSGHPGWQAQTDQSPGQGGPPVPWVPGAAGAPCWLCPPGGGGQPGAHALRGHSCPHRTDPGA